MTITPATDRACTATTRALVEPARRAEISADLPLGRITTFMERFVDSMLPQIASDDAMGSCTGMDPELRNLLYRRPDLYEHVYDEARDVAPTMCERLFGRYLETYPASLLDIGCGTGRDLAGMAMRCADCVGVDLQESMIAFGRTRRPGIDLRVGDMRSLRLGRAFQAITCIGNALGNLHSDDELGMAFATFAAHAEAGTLLVLETLNALSADGRRLEPPVRHRCAGAQGERCRDVRARPSTPAAHAPQGVDRHRGRVHRGLCAIPNAGTPRDRVSPEAARIRNARHARQQRFDRERPRRCLLDRRGSLRRLVLMSTACVPQRRMVQIGPGPERHDQERNNER